MYRCIQCSQFGEIEWNKLPPWLSYCLMNENPVNNLLMLQHKLHDWFVTYRLCWTCVSIYLKFRNLFPYGYPIKIVTHLHLYARDLLSSHIIFFEHNLWESMFMRRKCTYVFMKLLTSWISTTDRELMVFFIPSALSWYLYLVCCHCRRWSCSKWWFKLVWRWFKSN